MEYTKTDQNENLKLDTFDYNVNTNCKTLHSHSKVLTDNIQA